MIFKYRFQHLLNLANPPIANLIAHFNIQYLYVYQVECDFSTGGIKLIIEANVSFII